MKTLKLSTIAMLLLASFVAAAAEPNAFYIGTGGTTVRSWTDASLWKDGYCPTHAGDVVSMAGPTQLFITFPSLASFSFDSIVDAPTNTMFRFLYGTSPSRITVRQMKGYCSWWPFGFWNSQNWKINCAYSGFNFTGDAEEPSEINSYYLGTFPYFGVPAADGKARINRMMHKGMFVKEGPGELTVRGPVGPDSGAFAIGGALVIDAEAETRDDVPASGAFCHLDSSRNLYAFYDAESGRSYVTNWVDASENGFRAFNNNAVVYGTTRPWGRPYVSSKTVNGRPLVDFGRYRAAAEYPGDDGPSGMLEWGVSASNIREIFMAVEMNEDLGSGTTVAPIGNSGTCPFLMYSTTNFIFKQDSVVLPGDVRVNGAPFVAQGDQSDPLTIRVVSCKAVANQSADTFGRVGSSGRGGFLLGEALVYTNELTETERRQTIAYLKKRWLDAAAYAVERNEWDLGDIAISNATIGVEAGRTARVKRVQDTAAATGLATDGIVKTGDGTLVVDRVVPSNAPIAVEGGEVRFTNVAGTVPDDALPPGALVNFDAESSSFDYDDGSDTDITAWYSLENSAKYVATNVVYGGARTVCPRRVASATPTGLHAVDFLSEAISDSNTTNPRYDFPAAPVYSGFIIWKNNYDKYYRAAHFCSDTMFMQDRAKGQLLAYKSNAFGPTAGMNWRVNGLAVNPLDQTFAAMHGDGAPEDSEWVLISFDSSVPVNLNGIARSRSGKSGGGCLVAALVGYPRPLADHERRAAEAYLMKRWLGKEHPDRTAWSGALAFGEGVENTVDTEVDIAPASIELSSSSFEKKGGGTFALGAAVTNLSSISVQGGRLTAELPGDFCEGALFHFDASEADSFEKTDNGDGTYSVVRWNDVRQNGVYAEPETTRCRAMPILSTAAATGLLSGMPYVDFGPTTYASGGSATNDLSVSMKMNRAFTGVMEVHLVYADNANDGSKIGMPISYAVNGSDQSGFLRQYSKNLVYGGFNNMKCDSAVDGATVAMTSLKPDGFSVVSLVVTNHYGALESGFIDGFANDRNLCFGGVKIAEVVAFDHALDSATRTAIDAKMLKKWRGIGGGAYISAAMPVANVAPGAEFDLSTGEDVAVSLGSMSVVYDGGDAGCVRVAGAYDASSPCAVALSFAHGVRKVPGGTRVKILEADSLVNAGGVGSWTLALPAGSRASAHLVVDGNAVYVQFDVCGVILIVQ